MITNAMDLIKNILTDVYKSKTDLKRDALNVYTVLISDDKEPGTLTLNFSGQILSIPPVYYREAMRYYQGGEKIKAIKTIRTHGTINGEQPELRWSKEFVESIVWDKTVKTSLI